LTDTGTLFRWRPRFCRAPPNAKKQWAEPPPICTRNADAHSARHAAVPHLMLRAQVRRLWHPEQARPSTSTCPRPEKRKRPDPQQRPLGHAKAAEARRTLLIQAPPSPAPASSADAAGVCR
jgi:hypothetical protein